MAITTQLVQIISIIQTLIFIVLLLPINLKYRKSFLLIFDHKKFSPIFKIMLAIYTMILILFLDSIYKISNEDIFLKYFHKSNMYLTGFTLFNAIVLFRFTRVFSEFLSELDKSKVLKKQCMNQKDFVDNILKDLEKSKQKIKELENEKKKSQALLKQHSNNQKAFFELLDKYNNLKNSLEDKKAK